MKVLITLLCFGLITLSVSACSEHKGFNELYLEDRIECAYNITNCPKAIVVVSLRKNEMIDKTSRFKFIPTFNEDNKDEQDLEYTIRIDWCSHSSFSKENTYVKVRIRQIKKNTPQENLESLILTILLILLMISCIGSSDQNSYTDGFILGALSNSNNYSDYEGDSWGTEGGSNEW
jgi:hypothetical protein